MCECVCTIMGSFIVTIQILSYYYVDRMGNPQAALQIIVGKLKNVDKVAMCML